MSETENKNIEPTNHEIPLSEHGKKFEHFIEVVQQLRSENGCPWDRKQSPGSLKRYVLEETQELIEAIEYNNPQYIKEELGDVLFLIILLAQIHNENNLFHMGDVIDTITDKMIRRHPHVFDGEQVETVEELRRKWHEIKKKEKSICIKPKKN